MAQLWSAVISTSLFIRKKKLIVSQKLLEIETLCFQTRVSSSKNIGMNIINHLRYNVNKLFYIRTSSFVLISNMMILYSTEYYFQSISSFLVSNLLWKQMHTKFYNSELKVLHHKLQRSQSYPCFPVTEWISLCRSLFILEAFICSTRDTKKTHWNYYKGITKH